MPPLVNLAIKKIWCQSKLLENCLTFKLAKYNLVTFQPHNTIIFCKLQNVNRILLGAFPDVTDDFPMPPLHITVVKDICNVYTVAV